jgi:hypothetical protein
MQPVCFELCQTFIHCIFTFFIFTESSWHLLNFINVLLYLILLLFLNKSTLKNLWYWSFNYFFFFLNFIFILNFFFTFFLLCAFFLNWTFLLFCIFNFFLVLIVLRFLFLYNTCIVLLNFGLNFLSNALILYSKLLIWLR